MHCFHLSHYTNHIYYICMIYDNHYNQSKKLQDIKTCKKQNPKMSEEDILKRIVKYNLFANILGTL